MYSRQPQVLLIISWFMKQTLRKYLDLYQTKEYCRDKSKLIYWWPLDSDLNTALTHPLSQVLPGFRPPLKRYEWRQRPMKKHNVLFQGVQQELMLTNIATLQMNTKKNHRYLLSSSRLLASVLKMFAILLEMPLNHFFGSVMWQTTGTKVKVALSYRGTFPFNSLK